jgi:hypothetical protein
MTHAHNPAAPEGATGILVLADGTIVWGRGFGATGSAVGEVCFNTAMTGYQEVMTDPSYAGQIVTFTFPHIGNVGTNEDDVEADSPHALGCIVREDITAPSNFRDQKPFDQWMAENGRIGISGVDTRALTRRIREAGAPNAVFDAIAAMRWQPAIRLLPAYHDDPAYIDALATSLERDISALEFVPDAIVASFHGMPQRTLELGDPYHCHCRKTARLLSEKMGRELVVAFQSRFGRAKWLEPATDTTLEALAGQGKKNIAIFAPGFSSDCLETCEELAIRGKEQFEAGGGEKFAYLPCLNDSDIGIDMLDILVRRELSGWI